jgi:hypothetical protein
MTMSRNGKSSNKVARMQGGNLARPIGTKAAKRRDSLDALRQERQLEKQETAKAMIDVMKDIRKSIDKTADNIELTSKKIHIGAIFQTSSRMIDQYLAIGAKQQAESLLVSCRVHMTSEVEYEPREMGNRIFTYAKNHAEEMDKREHRRNPARRLSGDASEETSEHDSRLHKEFDSDDDNGNNNDKTMSV